MAHILIRDTEPMIRMTLSTRSLKVCSLIILMMGVISLDKIILVYVLRRLLQWACRIISSNPTSWPRKIVDTVTILGYPLEPR
jgi:hypothetical protein